MRREGKKRKNKAEGRRNKEEKRIRFNKKGISNFQIHIEVNSILMFPLE